VVSVERVAPQTLSIGWVLERRPLEERYVGDGECRIPIARVERRLYGFDDPASPPVHVFEAAGSTARFRFARVFLREHVELMRS
jgi:hypothetical protein